MQRAIMTLTNGLISRGEIVTHDGRELFLADWIGERAAREPGGEWLVSGGWSYDGTPAAVAAVDTYPTDLGANL